MKRSIAMWFVAVNGAATRPISRRNRIGSAHVMDQLRTNPHSSASSNTRFGESSPAKIPPKSRWPVCTCSGCSCGSNVTSQKCSGEDVVGGEKIRSKVLAD
ncbi:hypothetical protein TNIN_230101 [Trichonephila inaurata madagascariensis]|uniref:Uncharacterized protein n=1 Tax=Trichonephila inaurata madagascariensis TaxID=2747483 RepID=A0A8X6XBJ3_9ARAC|nr:hypothetical protein TNIN_230101 [Trichonephila inaurata madagascariensis]